MPSTTKETWMQRGQSWVAFLGLISAITIGIQIGTPSWEFADHPGETIWHTAIWVLDVVLPSIALLIWGFGSDRLNRLSDTARFRLVLTCWVPLVVTLIVFSIMTFLNIGE